MASSNLVPTPIVDRNGVASIRHKRPEAAGTALGSSVPPPSLPASRNAGAAARRGLQTALRHLCEDPYFYSEQFPNIDLLEERLESYPDTTVEAFHNAITRQGQHERFESVLASCLHNGLDGDTASYVVGIVGRCGYQGDWSDEAHADYSYLDALRMYRGWMSVNEEYGLNLASNLYASEENQRRFDGLSTLSVCIFDYSESTGVGQREVVKWLSGYRFNGNAIDWEKGWVLRSRFMLSHTAEHPEDAERFVQWFEDRGVVDDGILQQMLESETPALNDGLL